MATELKASALVVGDGAQRSVLLAHPDSACSAVAGIAVEAQLASPTLLVCNYTLHGDFTRVRLPDAHGGARTDGLWRHTCLEAFVGAAGVASYYEFNFSPALAWAAYRFEQYRHGMTPAPLARAPRLSVHRGPAALQVSATLDLAGLADLAAPRLQLALAAVIEDDAGRLTYWALRHAPGKPDFHRAEAFTLELRAP
jgi:hypothetical protein